MKTYILTAGVMLALSACAFAGHSTLDEIRALEAEKRASDSIETARQKEALPQASAPVSRLHRLTDGRTVNLADWTVVLFMQSTCPYSQKFDPVLKGFSQRTGLPVFPFSMDGRGDITFTDVVPATPDVLLEYFQSGIPLATPTTFLTNVHTMETYPLLQQQADEITLASRLDEVLRLALDRRAQANTNGSTLK